MAVFGDLDESKHSLLDHLKELRTRLMRGLLAIFLTTAVAAIWSPELLDLTVAPLTQVLRDRLRVETVLVHAANKAGEELATRLGADPTVRFAGRLEDLSLVRALAEERLQKRAPLELILVSTAVIKDDTELVADLLEGLEPPPEVVYLAADAKHAALAELQLSGATLLPSPPRSAALKRVIRRAAAAAGKAASGDKLVVLSPLEPFFAYMKIALVLGLFMACPVWFFQAWSFVASGLYRHEKLLVLPAVVSASALFIAGGAFAYLVVFPLMFDVLINQMMPASIVGTFTIDKYLSLLMTLTVAFGVVFELPLVLAMLSMLGVVTPAALRKVRKYAIVASFVLSAVITPTTDPLSMLLMAAPLVIFYEIGTLLAALVHRRRVAEAPALEPS